MDRKYIFILLLVLTVTTAGRYALAEITVEANIEPRSFSMLEGAILAVTVKGSSHGADIQLPEVDNLHFHSQGQSSQIQIINGSYSSSVTSSYQVEPAAPGTYTIPPLTVKVAGDSYTTSPITFTVTDEPAPEGGKSGDQATGELAFLKLSPVASHYLGEIVPVEIKAYFDQRVRVDLNSLPRLEGDGIVMEPLDDKPKQTEEMDGNHRYSVLTWNTSLSGIKAGNHPFRLVLDATMLIPVKQRRPSLFGGSSFFNNGFNDPFFDSVFGNFQRRPVTVQTQQLEMHVKQLPEDGKPPGFHGAIGNFHMSVAADPTSVETGEPITLLMAISGKGNFDRVTAPILPASDAWKGYTPSAKFEPGTSSGNGTKTFEQALVPKKATLTAIPQLTFSFFDPQLGQYQTLTSDPIAITVKETTAPAATPPTLPAKTTVANIDNPQKASPEPYDNLAPPHLELGPISARITPIFFRSWYLGFMAICGAVLLVTITLQFQHRRQQTNPERSIKKRREKQLATELAAIGTAMQQNDSRRFLQLCRNVLQQQLGHHWQLPAEAISLTDCLSRLPADSPLITIFRAADEMAYGGGNLPTAKMTELYEQLRGELEKLS